MSTREHQNMRNSDEIPVFYFNDVPNFGDMLSPRILEWMTGLRVTHVGRSARPKLLGLGSILDAARSGDTIWGTGVHPAFFNSYWRGGVIKTSRLRKGTRLSTELRVLCTRGPLTRDCLLQLGLDTPSAMGDPALLLPLMHPGRHRPRHRLGFIGHYADHSQELPAGVLHISPLNPWHQVISEILSCERVISSSLHGIISAEAYGVPCTWLRRRSREGIIKYLDYYLSTERSPTSCESIADALSARPMSPLESHVLAQRQHDLMNSLRKSMKDVNSMLGRAVDAQTPRRSSGTN